MDFAELPADLAAAVDLMSTGAFFSAGAVTGTAGFKWSTFSCCLPRDKTPNPNSGVR